MSNEIINPSVEATNPEAVGAIGPDALPASTPEYAPAAQVMVENVAAAKEEKEKAEDARNTSTPAPHPPHPAPAASLSQQAYDLMVEIVSRDPRFEINNNVRQVLEEVQHLRIAADAPQFASSSDLAVIRDTVQHIWAHLQKEGEEGREGEGEDTSPASSAPPFSPAPTQELINETRALVRSVNEEVNAARNNTIQLTGQMRTVMDVATRCLREMDKTALKYARSENKSASSHNNSAGANGGETGALLDDLHSLRDMMADGFENARLEPILPEPGETFRYNEHRAENGFAAAGKIKRVIYPGFRWTQPTPPVILLPAVVETE